MTTETGTTILEAATRPLSQRVLTSRAPKGLGLRPLVASRDLVWLFVRRDVKLRYTQSVLGPLWVVLQPLVPAALFTFVFTRVTKLDTDGVPYVLLVSSAMAPWALLNRAVTRGGGALIAERGLITKVWFPRLAMPVSAVGGAVVDYLVGLAIALLAALHAGWPLTARLLVLPLLGAWTMALALGVTALVAAGSVARRDLIYLLPVVLQVWLYVTPIGYPAHLAPGPRALVLANPLAGLAEAHRWALVGRSDLTVKALVCGLAITAAVLLAGLLGFRRADRIVADVV